MSLFGNKDEKAAQQAATKAEVDRLTALPAAELAAELMGAFASEDAKSGGLNDLQFSMWAVKDLKAKTSDTIALREPIREALQALEHAGLVVRTVQRGGGWLNLTREGKTALAENTVRDELATAP